MSDYFLTFVCYAFWCMLLLQIAIAHCIAKGTTPFYGMVTQSMRRNHKHIIPLKKAFCHLPIMLRCNSCRGNGIIQKMKIKIIINPPKKKNNTSLCPGCLSACIHTATKLSREMRENLQKIWSITTNEQTTPNTFLHHT